jgi:hypothetical protein
LQKYIFLFVYDAIHEVIIEKYLKPLSVSILVFCGYNNPNHVVSFNGDQVVTLVMVTLALHNLEIVQPGAFEQHGIVGVQNFGAYDCKSDNVKYTMYVDF